MFERLKAWWKKRQREIDLEILWPSIKSQAPDIQLARDAFLIHASSDPAYDDMTDMQLADYIEKLV